MSRGRPVLYGDGATVTVKITRADRQALLARAAEIARDEAGFVVSDLVREYIKRGLDQDGKPRRETDDPAAAHVRRLRVIARSALEMAKALQKTA